MQKTKARPLNILCVSDLHADWVSGGVDRFPDVAAALDVAVERALGWADLFLCLGDICNPNTARSHRAIAKCVEVDSKLRSAGVISCWLCGNHDVSFGTADHTMLELRASGARVFDQPEVEGWTDDKLEFAIMALPYTSPSHSYDPDEFVRAQTELRESDTRLIVIGHLNVANADYGSETEDMPRGREVAYPVAAIRECFPNAVMIGGHLHRAQVVDGVHIVGSLVRLTHGEESHTPSYLKLEVS